MAKGMDQVRSETYDILVHTDKGTGVFHEYDLKDALRAVDEFNAIADMVEIAWNGHVIATFKH